MIFLDKTFFLAESPDILLRLLMHYEYVWFLIQRPHTSYSSVLDLGIGLANEFNNSIEAQHDSLRMLRDWESDSRTRGNTRNVRMLI